MTGRVLESGETLKGAANLGVRPTFEPPKELLEPYFFDFDGDLYGREIEVALHHFLRPEAKFDSVEELHGADGRGLRAGGGAAGLDKSPLRSATGSSAKGAKTRRLALAAKPPVTPKVRSSRDVRWTRLRRKLRCAFASCAKLFLARLCERTNCSPPRPR